ncbi:TetR/AcrR family transcriptional regulator [Leptospira bandrabouensis]|uniref:TetR/AcrR family transcriptional regulator n=1 Tax=Leptospira bandrabouensis TaxID=2484903 RepID=A0A6H3P1X3_9LEPT|nr:TetR/AcrR family transcriptional regulator [Leptospira bandrabouensis]MCG6153275.1 TetR/AcrR family transcriptional regulator [Leptospira bandrabouensis]MCW7458615.1 TetR/AcrR family transcriptional regulator [Leptospira bandrabouensis]MCW7478541.1 TetR/AcrR family transcriptional regulator [Leptospira bandrabouensis]MCW7486174.1 TetR/AcrR family transcriptional regulator [Leptospira bandrabouensis]TGN06136.1 TetR/AcrR family transcriptional regulator [Leptospira bandrabouensis]
MAKKIKHKPGRPKKGQNQITRESVLDLAWDLIMEQGFAEFRLAGLAENLGIRTPSLYNHIRDLEDVRREMKRRSLQILGDRLSLENLNPNQGRKRIPEFLNLYRSFAKSHPNMYPLTIESTESDLELKPLGDRILFLCMEVFGFQSLDETAVHRIRILRSLLHGFIVLEEAGGFGRTESIEDSFQKITESLESGRLW